MCKIHTHHYVLLVYFYLHILYSIYNFIYFYVHLFVKPIVMNNSNLYKQIVYPNIKINFLICKTNTSF